MDTNTRNLLIKIMLFYSLLNYFIAPTVGYYLLGKNKTAITYGILIGAIISTYLWYNFGLKMVNL